jgi:rhodanese-related sulfurtransferase
MPLPAASIAQSRRLVVLLPLAAGALYLLGQSSTRRAQDFQVKEVLLEEAQALIAAGALVLDVRERAAYETRHLPGAVLAPVAVLAAGIPASLEQARTKPIVVYCGEGTALGPEGTHLLNKAGFTQAVNLKSGIQGWAAAGLPTEQGPGKKA